MSQHVSKAVYPLATTFHVLEKVLIILILGTKLVTFRPRKQEVKFLIIGKATKTVAIPIMIKNALAEHPVNTLNVL